jgi:hypothetical protein
MQLIVESNSTWGVSMSVRKAIWASSIFGSFLFNFAAFAQDAVPPVYSWMLPKTVLDVTIIYSYAECTVGPDGKTAHHKVNIAPTISSRSVADKISGWRTVDTNTLISFWNDQNITITTYSGNHILNSVAANPTSEASTIVGNIFTGVVKLGALAFGVAAPAAARPAGQETNCPSPDDPTSTIKGYKNTIQQLETALANGTNTDTPQNVLAKIQALQSLIADAQSKLTLTIQATIDPGYIAPDKIQVDPHASAPTPSGEPGPIATNGLIASLTPSADQIKNLKWFAQPIDPTTLAELQASLLVNVYMDFPNASPKISPEGDGYHQTKVGSHDNAVTYREAAYVPILVWRGDKNAVSNPGDDPLLKPVQLLPAKSVAFAQYGTEQMVPYKAVTFQNNSWSVTFADDGEITSASFASKSWGANATSVFSAAASTANSIASEQRAAAQANSPASQASAIQGQADLIYQTQRLALCQADPGSCPSK